MFPKVPHDTIDRIGWVKAVKGRTESPDRPHAGKDQPITLVQRW